MFPSFLQARVEQPVKDNISQKPPVTQVPQKPTDGEPTAKQNNLSAPTQQSKQVNHTEGNTDSWGWGAIIQGKISDWDISKLQFSFKLHWWSTLLLAYIK